MESDACPCENCVCLAICRLKQYQPLVYGCSIISEVLYKCGTADSRYRKPGFAGIVTKVEEALQPVHWEVSIHTGGIIQIRGINLGDSL